jgi:DNA mismatch endonuclease (patch repair protein)
MRRKATKKRSRKQISEQMSSIRKKDTRPEMIVRKLVHAMGYRFRLHRSDLPGTPDLVFPSRRKIIQVQGCFWHQHSCKLGVRKPATNKGYWLPKLARNVERDRLSRQALQALGWSLLEIWECETRDPPKVAGAIQKFLA